MTKKRILILGASGMLGRAMFKYFSKKSSHSVFGTSRRKNKNLFLFNAKKTNLLVKILHQIGDLDYIINCIGVLKNNPSKDFLINYTLPRSLEKLQKKYKFKLIHISTDDVFNLLSGKVNEKNKTFPDNPYAKSKLKGEVSSNLSINIRTSIIGFDPQGKKGLVEWLMKNKKNQIEGYENQKWTGSTTLQLVNFCAYLIQDGNFEKLRSKTYVIHFSPLGPISKYELTKKIVNNLKIDKKVIKTKGQPTIDRTLSSVYFGKNFLRKYTVQIDKALQNLINFENEKT